MISKFAEFAEVEFIFADMAGVARGKAVSRMSLQNSLNTFGVNFPRTIFCQTITGEAAAPETLGEYLSQDCRAKPDEATFGILPWEENTSYIICDLVDEDGNLLKIAPRTILREQTSKATSAPQFLRVSSTLEFYLIRSSTDPEITVAPVEEWRNQDKKNNMLSKVTQPFLEDLFFFFQSQGAKVIDICEASHPSQFRLTLGSGTPLEVADALFCVKRAVREAALKHGYFASFMKFPMSGYPANMMQLSLHYGMGAMYPSISEEGLLQAFRRNYCDATILFAPYSNSYSRPMGSYLVEQALGNVQEERHDIEDAISLDSSKGIISVASIGSDVNPYLAIGGLAACFALSTDLELNRQDEFIDRPASRQELKLQLSLEYAVRRFYRSKNLSTMLGSEFVELYSFLKAAELNNENATISSWEREYLLLNV